MENKKAIVIGGGISGLASAIGLKNAGFDVTLIEKSHAVGGVIGTVEKDGFKAESGSNTIMIQSQKTLDFLEDIGIKDAVEQSKPTAKKRFFARYGRPQKVPMDPVSMIFTRLFSFFGKLRLLIEPFIGKTPADADPSVEEFATRRLGKELFDYAINPFMAGIYAGDPSKLSIRHAFPPFWNLEQKYGSIVRGGMKARKDKIAAGNFFKPMMISFKGGMSTLPKAMAKVLGDSVKTDAKLISVDFGGNGWEVSWGTQFEDVCEHYDALVIAVPSPDIAELPIAGSLIAALEPLAKIKYSPVATLTLGFKKSDIAHPLDGFGVLIPEKENLNILGSLFISSMFDNRAPDGCVTLTNYLGGLRHPEHTLLSEENLTELAMEDLRKLLGVKAEPIFKRLFVWKHAIAQYNVGYSEFLDTMNLIETEFPNMALAGSYRGGVGVSSCIENGLAAAEKLVRKLR